MPSPRGRIKSSGDIHPPEVEYDLGSPQPMRFDDANLVMADASTAPDTGEWRLPAQPAEAAEQGERAHGYLAAARDQVRSRPVPALLGAFVLGLLLARL